jgi:hypothetical protein
MRNETELLESKELRNELAARVEVLEKVNVLFLIPQTDVATVKQVAGFYEVTEKVIEQVYMTHKDELLSDGMTLKKYGDFLNLNNLGIKKMQGKSIMKLSDESELVIPNRGLRVFPRRAILRIGMLLRDSQVAKEVRTQLLNIEEKTSIEVKTHDINEEQNIQLEIGMAYASGNPDTIMLATAKYMSFKNRHIEQLQHDNKALAGEILKWEDRSKINFAVRKLSKLINKQIGVIWNELYKELKYKHHIDVKLRGGAPFIQHIKKEEWSKVIQTFSAICEKNNISPSDILNNITEEV